MLNNATAAMSSETVFLNRQIHLAETPVIGFVTAIETIGPVSYAVINDVRVPLNHKLRKRFLKGERAPYREMDFLIGENFIAFYNKNVNEAWSIIFRRLPCGNCAQMKPQHADGKCLFAATQYEAMTTEAFFRHYPGWKANRYKDFFLNGVLVA